jgi:hypothetical protein
MPDSPNTQPAPPCECGHEKRKHFFVGGNDLGSCLHWFEGPEGYCDCEEFKPKREEGK